MHNSLERIELNGISFGSDTCIDEVLGNPQFHPFKDNDGHIDIFSSEQVCVDGYTFNIEVTFHDKQIDTIELVPVNLIIDDQGYPDKEYQEEKKKVADAFLRKHLGNPSEETEAILCYDFEWGSVISVSYLSGRNKYTGGFIAISYRDHGRGDHAENARSV